MLMYVCLPRVAWLQLMFVLFVLMLGEQFSLSSRPCSNRMAENSRLLGVL